MNRACVKYLLSTIVMLVTASAFCCSTSSPADLWDAIEGEDLPAIKTFLEQGTDLNKGRETDNRLPLMHAILLGKPSVVQFLIENGADVDSNDAVGNSCLMIAAFLGAVDSIQVLIASGADLFQRNIIGEDVLDLLEIKWQLTNYYVNEIYKLDVTREDVVAGRAKALPILINAREEAAKDDVWVALVLGRADLVKMHVDNVDDVDTIISAAGSPILVVASALGHLEIVRYLVEAGADIESRDVFGSTSLLVAAMFGRADIATLLIENSADMLASNYHGTDLNNALELDWDTTSTIAIAIGLSLDSDEHSKSRKKIKELVDSRHKALDDADLKESE